MCIQKNKAVYLLYLFLVFTFVLNVNAQENNTEQRYQKGEKLFNKEDYKKAFPVLLEVAKEGDVRAEFLVGKMYMLGCGVTKNYKEALNWYMKAANSNFAPAYNNIGVLYNEGWGVHQDYFEAIKWFRKAADEGVSMAQTNIGKAYLYGLGVDIDYKEAQKWLKMAADQDDANAQMFLGFLYQSYYGSFSDCEIAAFWYEKSANQGNVMAQYNLASLYYNGLGVKLDYKKAAMWYGKAAEQNLAEAQYDLGLMYERGLGVSKSYSKAATLYREAAEQGHLAAQLNLGVLYHNGLGVNRDDSEAIWWFRKSADQGNPVAYANLGIMYENGFAVEKNISEAINCYKKALELDPNYAFAKDALSRLGIRWQDIVQEKTPVSPSETVSTSSVETNTSTDKEDDEISIDASGTGFVIDKRGFLATNYHVTKGAKNIFVCLQLEGIWKSFHAVVVKDDPTNDLSIVRIDDEDFAHFSNLPYNFTTSSLDVASDIFTLGYPQVHIMGTEVKYTTGVINSKTGIQGDPTHYQISAHIDHGNSGGPMFNAKGAIVGITDSGLDKAEFGDVNYAIKSSYLKSLVDALPIQLELPHDTSIGKLPRVEQIKILTKYTALILIDLP